MSAHASAKPPPPPPIVLRLTCRRQVRERLVRARTSSCSTSTSSALGPNGRSTECRPPPAAMPGSEEFTWRCPISPQTSWHLLAGGAERMSRRCRNSPPMCDASLPGEVCSLPLRHYEVVPDHQVHVICWLLLILDVVDSLMTDPALLLIFIGAFMFIVTFFGCFGALRNAVCLLKIFLGIMVIIVLLQIAAAILGFLFSDMVLERTELLMKRGIELYRDDMDLENAVDFVQKKFQCCGGHSYKDWSYNAYFECSKTNPSLENCGVPFSCCIRQEKKSVFNTMCGYGTQNLDDHLARKSIYTTGCLDKIVWWGERNLLFIGGITVGVLCLEICMVSLAAAQVSKIMRTQQRNENS